MLDSQLSCAKRSLKGGFAELKNSGRPSTVQSRILQTLANLAS
jgi:hypothetical protein